MTVKLHHRRVREVRVEESADDAGEEDDMVEDAVMKNAAVAEEDTIVEVARDELVEEGGCVVAC
jgi:hypothetical protein